MGEISEEPAVVVDAKGLVCPMPIIKAKKGIDGVQVGQVMELLATDPGSMADFKAWTKSTGHELLEARDDGGTFTYLIRRTK